MNRSRTPHSQAVLQRHHIWLLKTAWTWMSRLGYLEQPYLNWSAAQAGCEERAIPIAE